MKNLGQTIRDTIANVGGPLALLQSPEAMAHISKNVTDALPPSPVILGAITRIVRESLVAELKSKPAPEMWMESMRLSGKFKDNDEIERFHKYCVEVLL